MKLSKISATAIGSIGAVLLLAGIALGFWPLKASDHWSWDTISCGSALIPDTSEAEKVDFDHQLKQDLNGVRRSLGLDPEIAPLTQFESTCNELIGDRRILVGFTVAIGLAVGAVGVFGKRRDTATDSRTGSSTVSTA
ncbi:hypothetical protein P3H15_27200 [Rhodococcus sp. T2V]|uniref:hypothetical protein n=1 Tax=Rhodococcus sp. T2V TaxID=3034164 RepID=UPI0023E265FD|nr:hypothetical protein [Rhodococcus sp. T2V]MDF3308709.1 hypothetical protein [Rhodococcus sp. T2V]